MMLHELSAHPFFTQFSKSIHVERKRVQGVLYHHTSLLDLGLNPTLNGSEKKCDLFYFLSEGSYSPSSKSSVFLNFFSHLQSFLVVLKIDSSFVVLDLFLDSFYQCLKHFKLCANSSDNDNALFLTDLWQTG